MKTKTESLEIYKEAIKAKFNEEKKGIYSSFFIKPSRAKLRQLCEEKLKNSINFEDLNNFKFLFGFDFDASNKNRLQANTDKFRPIETFLKGETDLTDLNAINLAAMLVDFNPRPFTLFSHKVDFNYENNQGFIEPEAPKRKKKEGSIIEFVTEKTTELNTNLKRKIAIGLISFIGLSSIGFTVKNTLFKNKECMQWQKDHYECVDCDKKGLLELCPIIPLDESLIKLRKIKVNKETPFFYDGKPNVWYSKHNNKLEFYNLYAIHPETGKPLKAITNYMINEHVKK